MADVAFLKRRQNRRPEVLFSLCVFGAAFPSCEVVHRVVVVERLRLQVFEEAGVEEHERLVTVAGLHEVLPICSSKGVAKPFPQDVSIETTVRSEGLSFLQGFVPFERRWIARGIRRR